MQVGRTKDQGFYCKPSAAVHPGALAAVTVPQYSSFIAYVLFANVASGRIIQSDVPQFGYPCPSAS